MPQLLLKIASEIFWNTGCDLRLRKDMRRHLLKTRLLRRGVGLQRPMIVIHSQI